MSNFIEINLFQNFQIITIIAFRRKEMEIGESSTKTVVETDQKQLKETRSQIHNKQTMGHKNPGLETKTLNTPLR